MHKISRVIRWGEVMNGRRGAYRAGIDYLSTRFPDLGSDQIEPFAATTLMYLW